MDKIFLIRHEDGMVQSVSRLTSAFLQGANAGELDIIDITDPHEPKLYCDEVWRMINVHVSGW